MQSIETELPLESRAHVHIRERVREKIREYERKKSVARASKYNFSRRPAAFQLLYRMTGCAHTRTNQDNENTSATSGAMLFTKDWISFALST